MERIENALRIRIEKALWDWANALRDCERRRGEIKRLLQQAEDAENVLKSQVLTGMPFGGGTGDPTGNALLMRDNALRRVVVLTDEINRIMHAKEQMDDAMKALPENYQQLFYLRYVKGYRVTIEIPRMLHASERTIKYWMHDALEKIAPHCPFIGV